MIYVTTIVKTAVTTAVLCICVSATAVRIASSAASVKPACKAPPYRQFDFWIGDWDAFDMDNPRKVVARTRVTRILGGCVLLEDYQGADGHFGQSFTIYDASRDQWHQTWVTNHGTLLVIEGGLEDGGKMVLQGTDRTNNNVTRQVRGTWISVPEGVQESAVISTDGGKTWIQWFDLIFRRHNP
jgi:hypothetical protein